MQSTPNEMLDEAEIELVQRKYRSIKWLNPDGYEGFFANTDTGTLITSAFLYIPHPHTLGRECRVSAKGGGCCWGGGDAGWWY